MDHKTLTTIQEKLKEIDESLRYLSILVNDASTSVSTSDVKDIRFKVAESISICNEVAESLHKILTIA